jgi:hypothetical protein
MTRRSILTAAVAVLGLALSAALAWSASQLAGQRIGLASEPLSVAQGLAPHHRAAAPPKTGHDDRGKISSKPAPKQTAPTTSTQLSSTSGTTPAPVTPAAAAPPASAPPATTAGASSATSGRLSSSGASRHQDDHHPDD